MSVIANGLHRIGWLSASLLIALGCALPVAYLLFRGFGATDAENWAHLSEHVLPRAWANTIFLSLGSVVGASVLGVALAGVVVHFEFPGRRLLQGLLVLPLSLPGYVIGFTWLGILEYSGPLQSALRTWVGGGLAFQPRGLPLLVVVFSLSLYPYVYLLAKSAFETLDPRMPEAARTLGGSGSRMRLRLSVPWILGGASLVFMETIADYGTVSVFNYDTVTVAILKAWHGLFSFETAARIAALLAMAAVLVVTLLEAPLRRRVVGARSARQAPLRKRLRGLRAFAAAGVCALVLGLGFFVPLAQLLIWAVETEGAGSWPRISSFVWSSFGIGALASGLILVVSLLLAFCVRFAPMVPVRLHARVATLGYALPGAVLAVAIHAVAYAMDRSWGAWLASAGLLWVMALVVRFTNVGFQPFRRGFERISTRLDEASAVLGAGEWATAWRVHRPLLLRAGGTAALLVFVDIVKEMPITLMTRPSGFETLALRVHQFTSEGLWAEAAFPALLIGAVGVAPALLLGRGGDA